ncbi:MAG: hypothetical protein CMJ78_14305 [Planctomycetaceae bacterium]|nr:hypothetical protein [Planctomycetaceae bacterium]
MKVYRVLVAVCLLLVVGASGKSADSDEIKVDKQVVRIELKGTPVTATIRSSAQLKNTSKAADNSRRVFPIAAPPSSRYAKESTKWCRILVNGKPVKAELQQLLEAESVAIREWPDQKRRQ